MADVPEEIIKDVRKFAELETEFRRFSCEAKRPGNEQDLREYLTELIGKDVL